MVLGSILMLALGQVALTVISDSEHSTCPDTQATRKLVAERLADRPLDDHTVHHAYVTDAQSGQSYVRLRLFNGERAILLERLIPVQGSDCADVPLAIAIIIENYFSDVPVHPAQPMAPPIAAGASKPESPTSASSTDPRPNNSAPPPARRLKTSVFGALSLSSERAFRVEGGINYFFVKRAFFHANLAVQVAKNQRVDGPYEYSHTAHSLHLGSGLFHPFTRAVGGAIIPVLGLHLERVGLRGSDVISDGTRQRVVPSLGGRLELYFNFTDRFWLGVGAQVSDWLGGQRFVVVRANQPAYEILDLPRFTWDGRVLSGFFF